MLPNNKIVAERRLKYLRRRMDKDADFASRYKAGMQGYLDDGYAEAVPDDQIEVEGITWYIPHHAVFSPKKPDKLRIVFDCTADYEGTSIKKAVYQGLDLTNQLLGVLLRFREKPIAMLADVQALYIKSASRHNTGTRFDFFGMTRMIRFQHIACVSTCLGAYGLQV